MKRNIFLWQFSGFAMSSLGGTILHFLYDWTNKSIFISAFSGVNESTWEHMKLLYFPLLIFALIQSRYFKEYKNYWCIKLVGILAGLVSIPILFYTYNGTFGKSHDWLNITIFFISTAIAFLIETWMFYKNNLRCKHPWLAFFIICLIGVLFITFTFFTPEIPLFKDPLINTYGINY